MLCISCSFILHNNSIFPLFCFSKIYASPVPFSHSQPHFLLPRECWSSIRWIGWLYLYPMKAKDHLYLYLFLSSFVERKVFWWRRGPSFCLLSVLPSVLWVFPPPEPFHAAKYPSLSCILLNSWFHPHWNMFDPFFWYSPPPAPTMSLHAFLERLVYIHSFPFFASHF